jgi:redox-sensitive bicupin YhaK (pirin superfamily)
MEIITYVLDGKLEHRDSIGNGSVIKPGDVQRMSAGTGIRHSEFNGSRDEAVRLLQIWIHPERPGMAPSYEQKNFPAAEKQGRLRLVGSRDGRDGAVVIHRDVDLYAAVLAADDAVTHAIGPRRLGWLQVARGTVALNGETLAEGDAAAIEADTALSLTGSAAGAEVLLFDMAA